MLVEQVTLPETMRPREATSPGGRVGWEPRSSALLPRQETPTPPSSEPRALSRAPWRTAGAWVPGLGGGSCYVSVGTEPSQAQRPCPRPVWAWERARSRPHLSRGGPGGASHLGRSLVRLLALPRGRGQGEWASASVSHGLACQPRRPCRAMGKTLGRGLGRERPHRAWGLLSPHPRSTLAPAAGQWPRAPQAAERGGEQFGGVTPRPESGRACRPQTPARRCPGRVLHSRRLLST